MPGLGGGYDISSGESNRNGLCLDRGWLDKTISSEVVMDNRRQSKFREQFHFGF